MNRSIHYEDRKEMSWYHAGQQALLVRALQRIYHHESSFLSTGHMYEKEIEHYFRHCGIDVQPYPNGSHRWPDLLVASSIPFELKTSKKCTIHLGATIPPPKSVYMIRAGSDTHITLGEDLVPYVYRIDMERVRSAILLNKVRYDSIVLQPRMDLTIRLKESTRERFFQRVIQRILDPNQD